MNIAIVDDSLDDRVLLLDTLVKCAKESNLLITAAEYENGEDFLQNAQLASIDVVFLDIYMEKMGGMEVAKKIRSTNSSCRIVFITSSPDFAVQSYSVRAFYYIVKPYTYKDIANIVNMLDKNLQSSSRYIKVKDGREWCKIMISDILYADYGNHYTHIHTENAVISTYARFPEIAEKLLVYKEFLGCYRCIVVNMDKIKKIDDLFFLLSNGEYLPINRKNAKEIKSRYTDYIFGVIEDDMNANE